MAYINTKLVLVTLFSYFFVASLAGTNVSLITLPINITSMKFSLFNAFNNPLAHLRGAFRDYPKKGSNSCIEEGVECTAETASCCIVPDYDLECLPSGKTDFHICRVKNSEELAKWRIDGLQYGNSRSTMNSHAWADSWEFQSKSEMGKEEEQELEDLKWKKSLNLSNSDLNVWMNSYKQIKNGGNKILVDLKNKLKKCLFDKYLKHDQSNEISIRNEGVTFRETSVESHVETTPKINHRNLVEDEESFSDYSWFYMDTKPCLTKNESDSDENFIKFSNEIPRQENKINFRIEDIIQGVTKLLSNKLIKKSEAKIDTQHQGVRFPLSSLEQHKHDLMDSEEVLKQEINELQGLNSKPKKPNTLVQLDPNELIQKHVVAILEEERKLDKLKKINEINRLEQRA